MPIIDQVEWDKCVKVKDDPYGKCCVDVARKVMEYLDDEHITVLDPHDMICKADKAINAGGITGFMAGCAANIVSQVHSRGDEFRKAWNKRYDVSEEKAKGGIVNPAILTINQ